MESHREDIHHREGGQSSNAPRDTTKRSTHHNSGYHPDADDDQLSASHPGPVAIEIASDEKGAPKRNLQTTMWTFIDTLGIIELVRGNEELIWKVWKFVKIIAFLIWLVFACVHDIGDAAIVLALTILGILIYGVGKIWDRYGEDAWPRFGKPLMDVASKLWVYGRWGFYIIFVIGVVVGLFFLVRGHSERLISAFGLLLLVAFSYVFSKHPRHVKWRPVIWGLVLQFLFGLLILRTSFGSDAFRWLGDLAMTFLGYSDAGAAFVFGEDTFRAHFIAFSVLPTVIYFSTIISILYYYGVMQYIFKKIAWVMQYTMRTSASESLNTAGNIFLGGAEASLMIGPLLKDMTKSELHAVMTGGFSSIAGNVLGAYIAFGLSASHLITASVMSAPAALAVSKLFHPETEKSKSKSVHQIDLPEGEQRNVIEAATHGAYTGVPLALNIAGNLIAYIALLALLNGVLGYMGGLVGRPQWSFEYLSSKVFIPLAWMMGVEAKDQEIVAELIGARTFVNQFFAYAKLSTYINNRLNDVEPYLSIRSEVIATYALCGFTSIGSIGIQLGCLTTLVPSRKGDLADIVIRAFVAGSVACFMTACVAGVLYVDVGGVLMDNTGSINDTMTTTGTMVANNATSVMDAIVTDTQTALTSAMTSTNTMAVTTAIVTNTTALATTIL